MNRISTVSVLSFVVLSIVMIGSAGVVSAWGPIEEDGVVRYNSTERAFVYEYTYEMPAAITRAEITFQRLARPYVTVVSSRNLDRVEQTVFEWEKGDGVPRIVFHMNLEPISHGNKYYAAKNSSFGPKVTSSIHYWYSTNSVPGVDKSLTFDGNGHAGSAFVYAGPHTKTQSTVDGVSMTVVVSNETDPDVNPEAVLELYESGERLTESRLGFDSMDTFVIPAERNQYRRPAQVVSSDIFLDDTTTTVDGIYNVPSHEYFHVRFGVFGYEEMAWLREGSAQYYGYLLSLNTGQGTFQEFHDEVHAGRYTDAVLSKQAGSADSADYHKGAHVLAALDAEIRSQTNGEKTFQDVITTDEHDLSTYGGFEKAVIETTGNESMAKWLETYVHTEAHPDIPVERRYFTLGSNSVEDIETATPTATATPTPTPYRTVVTESEDPGDRSTSVTERRPSRSNENTIHQHLTPMNVFLGVALSVFSILVVGIYTWIWNSWQR